MQRAKHLKAVPRRSPLRRYEKSMNTAAPSPVDWRDGTDHPRWYRRHRILIVVAIVSIALMLLLFFKQRAGQEQGNAGPPPAVVNADQARKTSWSEQLSAVGSLRAVQGVDVTTEIPGVVQAIRFENGTAAKRGDILVQLDTSSERAQLRALEAQREQAKLAFERSERLIQRGAIAQAELEEAQANFQNLTAQVEQTRTLIDKKRIDAPFAGELGIREVNLGQYVGPGTKVVSLQQIAPIYVDFELPEATLARIKPGQPIVLRVEAYGDRKFTGTINALDPDIDTNTRSIAVQAEVANEDRALRPGMFADVTVQLPGERQVTVVPASAITRNAYGDAVYLVTRPDPKQLEEQREQQEKQRGFFARLFGGGEAKEKEKSGGEAQGKTEAGQQGQQQQPQYIAKTAFVKTGERRGLDIEVREGLEPEQLVVTAGQVKLDDGAPIIVSQRSAQQDVPERPQQP
jgi:membrane fusion protein, multidrug efflux system